MRFAGRVGRIIQYGEQEKGCRGALCALFVDTPGQKCCASTQQLEVRYW